MTVAERKPEVANDERLLPIYLVNTRQRFKAEVNRLTRDGMARLLTGEPDVAELSFPMSYLYIFHWLRHNVPADYRHLVLKTFRSPAKAFLMDLLEQAADGEAFLHGYIGHWLRAPEDSPIQRRQLLTLLESSGGSPASLVERMMRLWKRIDPFTRSYSVAYRDLAKKERQRYDGMLADEDRQRLALVDALPDVTGGPPRFAKLGIIPAMGCPQTCRHCMFIFRPLMKAQGEPETIYRQVDALTDSVLFTGGDLTRHLHHFYAAIGAMKNITTFAILLNGDFADDRTVTREVLEKMAAAIRRRPVGWPRAKVVLQISFDEFHQEVIVDKKGRLKERIPVAKIANIVEAAPRYADEIQLCLLHKQQALNFSMDLFNKGVFARLANELGERGHQIQILSAAPAPRLKRNPLQPDKLAPVLKDASFVLTRHPDAPILLTSSTIDAYGRAELLDESETVKEKDLLEAVLRGEQTGESFDIDLMFWFNGWATLFNAVHMSLGNLFDDGMETLLARLRKDPLTQALHRFDRRLLDYYAERRNDLEQRIAKATGPHQLFHSLTEDGDMRLHMTERLIAAAS